MPKETLESKTTKWWKRPTDWYSVFSLISMFLIGYLIRMMSHE